MKQAFLVRAVVVMAGLVLGAGGAVAQEQPLLMRNPTVSRGQIAFSFAGDLWVVDRQGGDARRLTVGMGIEREPMFSPDGSQILFSGEYDGNVDVYTVPAAGGIPRRLTYHPGIDEAMGWTPDGRRIIFRSQRESVSRYPRLYTMSVDGGFPTEIPLPMAVQGSLSRDGTKIAYVPVKLFQKAWKGYRGGQTSPIWIAQLSDSSIVDTIPRNNSNDTNPMWVGDTIYFLSDRDGPVTLYAYDTRSKQVTQCVKNSGLDMKSASAGPGAIVYEQFGAIYLYDLESRQAKKALVRVAGDLPEVRPQFKRLSAGQIRDAAISPTGARAVLAARGEILTAPREKGPIRNLTNTPGVAERDPAWSPDGKWIAYFSDESGEYALHLRDPMGGGEVRKINLGTPPSFFFSPTWSPDSKKIAYTDKRHNLWYVAADGRSRPVKVDTNPYAEDSLNPAWSSDSRWLTYTKQLPSHLRAVFIYCLEDKKIRQVTDGMSDARFAAFDAGGKYLYFTASTDTGLTAGGLDMSAMDRRVTRSVYAVVLSQDDPSPLAPESDEEKAQPATGTGGAGTQPATQPVSQPGAQAATGPSGRQGRLVRKDARTASVRIDFDALDQRIISLPIPTRDYDGLVAGKANEFWLLEGTSGEGGPILHRFDLGKRKLERFLDGVRWFDVSANHEKMLCREGDQWCIISTTAPARAGEGALRLGGLEVYVDPRAEWKQMYREVWRLERDFLYDPNHQGLDLGAAQRKYEPYLAGIATRDDLNYLFEEMLGNLTLGHVYIRGGDMPEAKKTRGGLLGADYEIANGRYRFKQVYRGENWNPQLQAPLTQPGVNVKAGEYLLAVRGRELRATDNIYSFFEETAGTQITIRVGPNPNLTGSREITVVPIDSESALRNRAWIDGNRRRVDQATGGRVAYVYLPDTSTGGYSSFNRYYFSQIGKEAAIIDERFNSGGKIADYIIDYLRRPLLAGWTWRDGRDTTTPLAAIFGPKVMIINEYAGSGGDALPWMFRKTGIGPLIGKRTWGGLVGIGGYPELIDGGSVTAPYFGFYNPQGTWDVENHGVDPDVAVEWDPVAWRSGRDAQLEKAIETVLAQLAKTPPQQPKRPAFPMHRTLEEHGN